MNFNTIQCHTIWNSLPDHVKNASFLEAFKSRLKTHLFKHSYDCC